MRSLIFLYLLVIAIITLVGCGPRETPAPVMPLVGHVAPPSVESYVSQFEQAWGEKVLLPIRIVNADEMKKASEELHDENVVGLTVFNDAGTEILLLDDFWYSVDSSWRFAVLFHELGHAVLSRDHDETMINGCPTSIMYPTVDFVGVCVDNGNRTSLEYMKELFGK